VRSLLRFEAADILRIHADEAWAAFARGESYVAAVPPEPTFVPFGAKPPAPAPIPLHTLRFVPGHIDGRPAYSVRVDDTPGTEEQLISSRPPTAQPRIQAIWDLHVAQHEAARHQDLDRKAAMLADYQRSISPDLSVRGTEYPDEVPLDSDYDVATQSDAARLSQSSADDALKFALRDLRKFLLTWGCYLVSAALVVYIVDWWVHWPGPVWHP
jgi:predicted component of type VI protein secretion system